MFRYLNNTKKTISIQNIKINLYQEEFNEVEHTPEEAQSTYEKINTIPIANRVDVNA